MNKPRKQAEITFIKLRVLLKDVRDNEIHRVSQAPRRGGWANLSKADEILVALGRVEMAEKILAILGKRGDFRR